MNTKIPIVILIIILGLGAFLFFNQKDNTQNTSFEDGSLLGSDARWYFDFDSKEWRVSGNPPDCPEPLALPAPVDVKLASGIIYPGQIRGGDYKPHGGFRFDNRSTNIVEVRAIMDGYVLKASRYEDSGDVQNFLFYVNDCGIMVMHDHLLTLSSKLQEMFDKLPLNKNGDSRTTVITSKVYLKKGEVMATEVGYKKNSNIFLDFGLYDLRRTNGIEYNDTFRAENSSINEYGAHGLCWLDYLSDNEKIIVRNLPAGGHEGKVSDYCG